MKNTAQEEASSDGASQLVKERYMKWWLEDYPPISSRLCFVIHIGLWYFTIFLHDISFFFMIEDYEFTDREMFNPRGLLGFLGFGYIDPGIL
jgi:hypothetical protein